MRASTRREFKRRKKFAKRGGEQKMPVRMEWEPYSLTEHDRNIFSHLRKGHKKTFPYTSLEEMQNNPDFQSERGTDREISMFLDEWHSDHHAEHKDFMLHIGGPYSHS